LLVKRILVINLREPESAGRIQGVFLYESVAVAQAGIDAVELDQPQHAASIG
jgi:hypothetical protein